MEEREVDVAKSETEKVELYREEFAAVLPAVEHWHKMAVQHSRIAIWCAACCGAELTKRKKEIGHGGWMKFIKTLSFSDDTARRYMNLAEEWESRIGQIPHGVRNLESDNILAGGSRAFIDLDDAQVAEISEATTQAVGSKTLNQLYFDWGICKAPYHPGGNMRGEGAGRPPAPSPDEIRQTWADEWVRVVGDVYDQACRKKTWCHLTDGELAEHTQSIIRVLEELENEVDRRKKSGKGRG
jgi:hypothetical protein